MTDQNSTGSPLAALFFGVIVALGWIIVLSLTNTFDNMALVHLITTGAMGAVGASFGAFLVARAARKQIDKLDEAAVAARYDPLTGLVNRAELFRQLDESIKQAEKNKTVVGVLFLDLDGFKQVNDTMGHDTGDELLQVVADRLKNSVRTSDLVSRLGGDEFVVVCRDLLHGRSVESTAKQILRSVREPITIDDRKHLISTSIGVAIAEPGDERSIDELVGDADLAMYKAKRTKTGYELFDQELRTQGMDKAELGHALVEAIDSGQIVVFYQPIVDTRTKGLYAFEALVRWLHPEKGLISPGVFVPVAEELRLMNKLGNYVLREACAQAAVWNHACEGARRVRMSVNLAEQQLQDPNLVEIVAEHLRWSGLPAQQLVLEITENVVVDHLDSLAVLRGLRGLGLELSIDDFGTGQSSLSYLKQFDMVTAVKIDQTFVRDMACGNVDQAIIEAVVAMASVMDLKVIAEGVERPDQLEALVQMGIRFMQGYLFKPPVAPQEVNPAIWFPHPQPSIRPASAGSTITAHPGPGSRIADSDRSAGSGAASQVERLMGSGTVALSDRLAGSGAATQSEGPGASKFVAGADRLAGRGILAGPDPSTGSGPVAHSEGVGSADSKSVIERLFVQSRPD